MKLARVEEGEQLGPQGITARLLLEGEQSNARLIRLAAGQALPSHRHGASDLMLYVIAGQGELDTPAGVVAFPSGGLAFYRGDEELRVRNAGSGELTLLAFLAPKAGGA
jgi:quercetin dioxygenase-like cupin family protein